MVGNVGQLVFFFFTLAATIIVGLFTITYAAHCFLTIVEDTAAGSDEVDWPDEPPTDWYGKPFYLIWLLSLPIVPAGAVILLPNAEMFDSPRAVLALLLGFILLFFPLCLWSSLAASTSWLVVHFGMYGRVFRHPLLLGLFYILTAPILVIGVALAYYGITLSTWGLLPVTAVAGSALLFIYARLLGRIAWLACQGLPTKKKKKQKRLRGVETHDPWVGPAQQAAPPAKEEAIVELPPASKPAKKPSASITTIDPWAMPEDSSRARSASDGAGLPPVADASGSETNNDEEDEWTPNKKPYGLARSEGAGQKSKPMPPISKPKAISDDEEEDEWTPNKKPYALKDDIPQEKSQPEPVRRLPAADDEEDEWTPNKKPYGFQREEEKSPRRPEETRITAKVPPQEEENIMAPGTLPPRTDSPVDPRELPMPSRLDVQIYLEPYRPYIPRWTLFSGVWEFPLYGRSVKALIYLSATTFLLGFFLRIILLVLWPF